MAIPGNTFGRKIEVTRKEAAKIFALVAGANVNATNVSTGFSDVPSSSAYAAAVKWVKDNGVMNGTSSTLFSPDATITRQEICVALNQLRQVQPAYFDTIGNYSYYNDHDEISSWASTAVYYMTRWGIVSGDNYGNFNPKTPITRQEMAAIIYSYWNLQRYILNVSTTPVSSVIQNSITNKLNEHNSMSWAEKEYLALELGVWRATVFSAAYSVQSLYPIAADMLIHYLEGAGETYEFPVSQMLNDNGAQSPYELFETEFNDSLKTAEVFTSGRTNAQYSLKSENSGALSSNDGNNYYLALGKYRASMNVLSVTRSNSTLQADFRYVIRDFYDYESDDPYDTYKAALFSYSALILDTFNRAGIAHCYLVEGSTEISKTWTEGARLGIGLSVTIN